MGLTEKLLIFNILGAIRGAGIGLATGNIVIGYFYDFTGTYIPIFWIAAIMQVVSLILLGIATKYAPALQTENQNSLALETEINISE